MCLKRCYNARLDKEKSISYMPTPDYLLLIFRHIYHYLSVLSPAWANGVAMRLGLGRRAAFTKRGTFWVDPLSNFGQQLIERGEYEAAMATVLDRYVFPGAVFVDLGANEGYFSILASKSGGPTGKVYAIEPQARCQEVIRENCRLNQCANVSIIPVAVSDHAGQLILNLHPATNTGATSIWRTARSSIRTSLVECMTLHAALDAEKINAVHLLKIDIEGAEYEAVLGSPEVFNSGLVKVIALEYHPDTLSRRGLQAVTIHDFLLKAGYTLDSTLSHPVYVLTQREDK